MIRFRGNVGEKIIVQVTDQSGSIAIGPCLTLNGPNGMPTSNGQAGCVETTARVDETLQQAGVYTLVVQEGWAGGTLPYLVSLQCVAGACAPPSQIGVGGTVRGLSPTSVTCTNRITGRRVTIRDRSTIWDCEAAGLVVNSGDRIVIQVLGVVAD
jgi:hypothetical protein